MPGDSVFVVHSPYQILLSYAIAVEDPHRAHLFVCPYTSSENAYRLLELLSADGTIDSYEILDEPTTENGSWFSNWHRKRIVRKNIRKIRSFVKSADVQTVYSTLDDREIVQAAMHFAEKYGRDPTFAHVEDGGEEYTDYRTTWSPYRSDRLNSLETYALFGFFWENREIYGTSRQKSEIYAVYPEFLRPELADKKAISIDPSPLRKLGQSESLDNYLRTMEIGPAELQRIDTVVLVPLVSGTNSSVTERIVADVVEAVSSTGRTVGLKFHPRQIEANRPVFSGADVVELPQEIPLELIFVSAHATLDSVVGSHSTVLKSAMWLSDTISAVSIYPLLVEAGLWDEGDQAVFLDNIAGMGVKIVEDLESLQRPELFAT